MVKASNAWQHGIRPSEARHGVAADVDHPGRRRDRGARRIRQLGATRVLYGSDLSPPGGSVRRGWEIFRAKVPLTAAELQQIASNRTRFMR